jgi:L-ascorbate metabolism protein UlaG (beta-lactamase superfamily)
MTKFIFLCLSLILFPATMTMAAEQNYITDKIKTGQGDLAITFFGHASLMMSYEGKNIHIDPVTQYADYANLPKADLILVTHEHYDHFDPKAINSIRTDKTIMIATATVAKEFPNVTVMKNGEKKIISGIKIEAVPAYNIVNMRSPGVPFHAKGIGNGYIITCGGKRIYIAGDTENIPEMKSLKKIDIAFLPMNLPYTMTPEMVADAVKAFHPVILYPYHYGQTDTAKLLELLKDEKNIEVRIRKMM